jgi:hypothetical protein
MTTAAPVSRDVFDRQGFRVKKKKKRDEKRWASSPSFAQSTMKRPCFNASFSFDPFYEYTSFISRLPDAQWLPDRVIHPSIHTGGGEM